MKRASYREAVYWLAWNDDTHWLDDEHPMLSVSTAMISDIFGVGDEKITADLRREVAKRDKELCTR